jgi:hypothetical protein
VDIERDRIVAGALSCRNSHSCCFPSANRIEYPVQSWQLDRKRARVENLRLSLTLLLLLTAANQEFAHLDVDRKILQIHIASRFHRNSKDGDREK